jgi:hypothetical protein
MKRSHGATFSPAWRQRAARYRRWRSYRCGSRPGSSRPASIENYAGECRSAATALRRLCARGLPLCYECMRRLIATMIPVASLRRFRCKMRANDRRSEKVLHLVYVFVTAALTRRSADEPGRLLTSHGLNLSLSVRQRPKTHCPLQELSLILNAVGIELANRGPAASKRERRPTYKKRS